VEVTAGDWPKTVPIFAGLSCIVKQNAKFVRMVRVGYRCEVQSLTGFVQLLACNYLPHGYWFYVTGQIPAGKNPYDVDDKMLRKYGIARSRSSRARRKAKGLANIHYVRHESFFVLLATHGQHRFFDDEHGIRDARKLPILYAGYSISIKLGGRLRKDSRSATAKPDGKHRVRVQIDREYYRQLKEYFLAGSQYLPEYQLAEDFYNIGFEPYAPVRQQLLNLLRLVNKSRKQKGLPPLDPSVIRYRRRIVRPFEFGVDFAA